MSQPVFPLLPYQKAALTAGLDRLASLTTTRTEAAMSTLKVTPVTGTELHHRYPRESKDQPVHVSLNCETGELSAQVDMEIGMAVPRNVHEERRIRWTIPALRAKAANAFLASIAPLAARVLAGFSAEYKDGNRVGRFDEDAAAAREEIRRLADQLSDADRLNVWQAADLYVSLGSAAVQARELGVTATSSDEDLESIAKRERANFPDEIDMVEGLPEYLRRLREAAQRGV